MVHIITRDFPRNGLHKMFRRKDTCHLRNIVVFNKTERNLLCILFKSFLYNYQEKSSIYEDHI
jgi:hypothetical protein